MRATEGEALGRKYLSRILSLLMVMAAFVILCPNVIVMRMRKARQTVAHADIARLSAAVNIFEIDTGQYPSSLAALTTRPSDLVEWDGPYLTDSAIPTDPWDRPYAYTMDCLGFTIACYGADGVEGGTDEDADIVHHEGDEDR